MDKNTKSAEILEELKRGETKHAFRSLLFRAFLVRHRKLVYASAVVLGSGVGLGIGIPLGKHFRNNKNHVQSVLRALRIEDNPDLAICSIMDLFDASKGVGMCFDEVCVKDLGIIGKAMLLNNPEVMPETVVNAVIGVNVNSF